METSPDRTRRSGGHGRSGPLLRTRDADAAPPRHQAPVAASRRGTRGRPGRSWPVTPVAGAAAVVVLLAAAGTSALLDDGDRRPPARADEAPAAPAAAPRTAPDRGLPAGVRTATGPGRTPADARAALETLLTARVEGNLSLLRSTWSRDEAGAAGAAEDLATSGAGLHAVLSAWWDDDLAGRVRTGLDEQSLASRAYAAAVAAGDGTAADRARGRMAEVSRALGGVLAGVTDGRIAGDVPPQDAAQYRAFVDALEADDAVRADEAAAWLRARLAREGAALAAGLAGAGPS